MKQFTDRTAVITGAGSGIGRALSLALAERGCRLALSDIDGASLAETARLVDVSLEGEVTRPPLPSRQSREGTHPSARFTPLTKRLVTTHVVDVSDKTSMEAFASEVVAAHGSVHLLVNNAGVSVSASFEDHTLEDFEWLMAINFWGVVYGCKFFLPALRASGDAHIVNISSVFGLTGVPRQSSYCASKFAVRGFSESLRIELKESGIGVTSVHPGGVATNIAARMRVRGDDEHLAASKRIADAFKNMLPPRVVAEAIIRGIEQDKPRVLIARETYAADVLKRLLPGLSTDLVAWGYQKYKERSARGA